MLLLTKLLICTQNFLKYYTLRSRLTIKIDNQGPVVQSIVTLTSSSVVKMLTVLVSTISNSQVFLLKKNVSSFCKCKSYSHFFSKHFSIYAIFNDQSFNATLTNDILSFEQLGPDVIWVTSREKRLRTYAKCADSDQPTHT